MITKSIAPKLSQDDATEDTAAYQSASIVNSQIVNGRFRILSELGRGGMAVVHLAEDTDTGKRVAIFGSTRNTTEYSSTISFVDELCKADLATKLVLEPLSATECQQLIATQLCARHDEVDNELSAKLAHECLGNPFYICQTIREWKLSNRVVFDGQRWALSEEASQEREALPVSVRDALKSRLRALPEGPAKTLSIAAAIGSIIDVDLLKSIDSPSRDFEFFDVIDDLIGREILRETGKPRILAFSHDLLREATLSNLTATRRQGIHQAIGETLEKRTEDGIAVPISILAEHFLASGLSTKAFRYLLKAGQAATETHAHVNAIPILEQAIQLTPTEASKSEVFQLHECLGRSYSAQDNLDEGIREFQVAHDNATTNLERAASYNGSAKCYQRSGNLEEAQRRYFAALTELGEWQPKTTLGCILQIAISVAKFHLIPSALQRKTLSIVHTEQYQMVAEIYFSLRTIAAYTDLFKVVYFGIRSAVISKRSKHPESISLALSTYASNYYFLGDLGILIGKRYLQQSKVQLRDCKSTFAKALTIQNIAVATYISGDLVSADQWLLESESILEKTKDWHLGFNHHWRRHIASLRGDSHEIEKFATLELNFAEKAKDPILRAWSLFGLADALSRMGKIDQGILCGKESIAISGHAVSRSIAYQELGRALIQSSQYSLAESTLNEGYKYQKKKLFFVEFGMQGYSLYPEAVIGPNWSLGVHSIPMKQRVRAVKAARFARWWALTFPNMRAHTYRVSGRVAAACGKAKRAIKFFDRALVEAQKFGNRGEYARTLIDKSLVIDGADAIKIREEGLLLLKGLHTVLPEAEVAVLESRIREIPDLRPMHETSK